MGDFVEGLNFLATIMLTTVAFLHLMSTFLPRLSYFTLMDWYIVSSFGFTAFIGAQVFLLDRILDHVSEDVENTMSYLNLGLWTVLHLSFFWRCRQARLREMVEVQHLHELFPSELCEGWSKKQEFIE